MATYAAVNGAWPDNLKAPTPKEAITGAKRLVRLAYKIANDDLPANFPRYKVPKRRFVLTSGRRYTYIRHGVWYVNPNGEHFGGWRDIVHFISHWAGRRFWPKEDPHSPRHVWIEKTMTDYVVANFLDGQLRRPEKIKPPVDKTAVRAARVAERIKKWEAKRRRAETALRTLRKQARYYDRRSVENSRLPRPVDSGEPGAAREGARELEADQRKAA